MRKSDEERLKELLADRATQGSTPEELNELNELLKIYPESDQHDFDLAAAALNLADMEIDEPLPDELRARVLASAFQYVNTEPEKEQASQADQSLQGPTSLENASGNRTSGRLPRQSRLWQQAGWYVAAACFVLALLGWWPRLTPKPAETDLFALREKLLAESPDVIRSTWKPANYHGAELLAGDVVWSNTRQQGFMRFTGMPAMDPQVGEYQLWIFDADQDEKYPVDGGVFAIDKATGEVIVRINAKLKIAQPTLFAVTVEKPGGVVVSKRDPLVAVAKVE
jgi:hypothetical protein